MMRRFSIIISSGGIGIHRDALRYQGLVFIITLAGESRFCLCDDREGNGARPLDDSPGRLTILSAPGFNGRDGEAARPLHFVDQVEGGVFRSVCATILNFLANDLSLLLPDVCVTITY